MEAGRRAGVGPGKAATIAPGADDSNAARFAEHGPGHLRHLNPQAGMVWVKGTLLMGLHNRVSGYQAIEYPQVKLHSQREVIKEHCKVSAPVTFVLTPRT